MILSLDPDLESNFQLFGGSGSGLGSSKGRNHNIYSGIMIPALDPEPDRVFSFLLISDPD